MNFANTIRQLRDTAGLTQQDAADAAGIARATYVKLENGGREPKLDELRRLSQYYEISIQGLVEGDILQVNEPSVIYGRNESNKKEEIIPRDIDPTVKPQKLRQVLLYILGKIGAKPNVGETVLYKLLYFIDFDYYEKTGQSITGLTYIHNKYGPSPVADFKAVVDDMRTHDELDIVETKYFKNKQKKYLPLQKASLDDLISGSEIKHVDDELERLGDKSAAELTALSHRDTPWIVAKQGHPIDYRDTFYRTPATAVTEPNDEL